MVRGGGHEPLDDVIVVGVDLDGVDPGAQGDGRRLGVLGDQPADLVGVQRVGDAMVVVPAEGGRGPGRHPTLLHHLNREVPAGAVDPAGELADAFRVGGVAEEARAMGANTGHLEAEREAVAHEVRPTADPLHATVDLGEPHRAVLFELGLRSQQVAVAATVWRHDDPVRECQVAHLDRRERVRESSRHRRGLPVDMFKNLFL